MTLPEPDHPGGEMLQLIEPLGLLHGAAAREAFSANLALPLAGGPSMFTLCRLIAPTGSHLVPVGQVPADWSASLTRVTGAVPDAGLPPGPLVMGILNVTPDSFSDGGRYVGFDAAIDAGLALAEQGASLIDVGGESTRPGAEPVASEQEQARILPVVEALARAGVLVSVDTRHAATMRAALQAGAHLVNDVSALGHDPASRGVVAETGCPVVLMHMRGTPRTMAGLASYDDVATRLTGELALSIDAAMQAGIRRDRLLIDPGIGFAKTAAHNVALLGRLPLLANLGCRVMLGVSRKGFIGEYARPARPLPAERDPGSIASALPGLAFGNVVLRVHDVPGTVQAVRLWQAIHG